MLGGALLLLGLAAGLLPVLSSNGDSCRAAWYATGQNDADAEIDALRSANGVPLEVGAAPASGRQPGRSRWSS